MKINVCYLPANRYAGEIVATALVRSFTTRQVAPRLDAQDPSASCCTVWINPPEEAADALERLLAHGGKAIVLGRIGPRIATTLGLELQGPIDLPADWADCQVDVHRHHDASAALVRYDDVHSLARRSPLRARPLCRFDFAREWNNLGYGRITLDGSAWSLQSAAEIGDATPIARLATPRHDRLIYAAVRDTPSGAALWFNRPVGPVDSLEWCVIESFLGDYRPDALPCFPYVSETPAGFRGAVCARLDCDEAVAASEPLWALYGSRGLPLSLAVLTGQTIEPDDLKLMRELIAAGGSVVSHSVHHHPNWGGSYERAYDEARQSRAWFDQNLPEAAPVHFAVSPFHQNPPYAVAALADCGYEGFLGGILANDPEYLLGRAGRVPFAPRPIVSLSAQCMLHGDCYHRYGDSMDVYCESFDQHLAAGSIFAFLDHPFSARYRYGWDDEATRAAAHSRLIDHIQQHPGIWWANLNDLLDFLRRRDAALVETAANGTLSVEYSPGAQGLPLEILWKGQRFAHGLAATA
jgi:hypothetical protein